MFSALLDKIAGMRTATPRSSPRPSPAADDSPPVRAIQANDFKGIPSDAFFFDWTGTQDEAYPRKTHPDGSTCGAGCGASPAWAADPMSKPCASAYLTGNTSGTLG